MFQAVKNNNNKKKEFNSYTSISSTLLHYYSVLIFHLTFKNNVFLKLSEDKRLKK